MTKAWKVVWLGCILAGLGCGGRGMLLRKPAQPPAESQPTDAEATPAPLPDTAPEPRTSLPPAQPAVREPPRAVPVISPPPPEPAAPVCPDDDPVDGRTHYMAALEALQVGEEKRAWEALFLSLCKTPDNQVAQRLLRQVEAPPETFFQGEFTEYRVQPGDTLSKVAKQAYGDPFLFYALARFNSMDNPSLLRAGQTLRVPTLRGGTAVPLPAASPAPEPLPQPASPATPKDRSPPEVALEPPAGRYPKPVRVTLRASDNLDPAPAVYYQVGEPNGGGAPLRYTEPLRLEASATLSYYAEDRGGNRSPTRSARYEVVSRERLRAAEALRDRKDWVGALAALEALLGEDPGDAEARGLFQDVTGTYAETLVSRDQALAAREVLLRAEIVAPGSPEVSRLLAAVEQQIGIDQLLANATQAMDGGQHEEAYSALQQVLELDGAHPVARGKLVVVRSALIDRYSKDAMGAYRRQDLDESLRLWDRVLALNPADETAQLRRAEVLHLKQQFEKKFQ